MVVVMTACSMRSVIADGFVAIWTWTASADPAGEGATGVAALLAQLSFTAVGAFVNGVYSRRGRRPRGRVVGGVGGNAVFLHALLQWVCRSVGVKPRWQTGQGVVPWSSRDGDRSGAVVGSVTVAPYLMRPAGFPLGGLASSGRRVSTRSTGLSIRGLLTDRAPAGSPVTGLLMGCRARFGVST